MMTAVMIASLLSFIAGWMMRSWIAVDQERGRRQEQERLWKSIQRARSMHPSSRGTWRDE